MALESLFGRAVSWSDVNIIANILGGIALGTVDIKSISHESVVSVGEQMGASGGRVLKRTTGSVKNTGSATYYRSGLRDLKRALVPVAQAAGYVNGLGQVQLGRVTFDHIIGYSWVDDPEIYLIKLLGCRLFKDSGKHEEGDDPNTVDIDINPLQIVDVIDGVDTVLL